PPLRQDLAPEDPPRDEREIFQLLEELRIEQRAFGRGGFRGRGHGWSLISTRARAIQNFVPPYEGGIEGGSSVRPSLSGSLPSKGDTGAEAWIAIAIDSMTPSRFS